MRPEDPLDPPLLGAGEGGAVHLLWARVPAPREGPDEPARGALSEAERTRLAAFRTPLLRARYAFRRTWLRRVLGRYLDLAPEALRLGEGPHRKPFLDPEQAGGLRFNLSHAEDLVLVAVARGREVGVDVETLERRGDFAGVARRVFTAREQASLEGLSGASWAAAFLRGWTRKEALLKALGTGLLREPRDVHVGLEERAGGRPWAPDDGRFGGWGLLADTPAPRAYAAAVCAQGTGWDVRVVVPPPGDAARSAHA